MDNIELYKQAIISYKIYLVMASSAPMDVVVLKWPDIAESAIRGDQEKLAQDLHWMIYDPIKIVYNSVLERAVQVMGVAPERFKLQTSRPGLMHDDKTLLTLRAFLIHRTDELLGLIKGWTGIAYPTLSQYLEEPCKSPQP